MFEFCFKCFCLVTVTSSFPLEPIKGIAEGYYFNDVDNYLPKYDDIINYQYSANNLDDDTLALKDTIKSEDSVNGQDAKVRLQLKECYTTYLSLLAYAFVEIQFK